MNSLVNVAVIDFCGTLYAGQSLQEFLEFAYKHTSKYTCRRIRLKLSRKKYTCSRDYYADHLAALSLDKGAVRCLSERFYNEVLMPGLDFGLISRIKSKQYKNIIVASGALFEYLQFLNRDLEINALIASGIKCIDNRIYLERSLCIGEQKKKRVLERFPNLGKNVEFDFYTDSPLDLPLLNIATNCFVKRIDGLDWMKILERRFYEI